jgi:SAM-dependent methyltransferase
VTHRHGAAHAGQHNDDGHEEDAFVYEVVVPDALGGIELGDDVLEIGPGGGRTTDQLRARTAHVTAVEVDPDSAAALARRLAGTNVDVVQGDAADLAFVDDRFSAAASFHMLHHIESVAEQDHVFAELARVLAPGGVLVAVDGVHQEGSAVFGAFDRHHPLDPAGLVARLERVGFVDVVVRTHEQGSWVCIARAT